MSTVSEKLISFNFLRKAAGLPELKTWKKSKALLEQRIEALRRDLNMADVVDQNNGAPGETAATSSAAEFPSRLEPKENKVRLSTLKKLGENLKLKRKSDKHRQRAAKIIIPMIKEGMSNEAIFKKLMDEQPEILCTEIDGELFPTKKWYIGWFRGDLQWQASMKKHAAQRADVVLDKSTKASKSVTIQECVGILKRAHNR